jgi:multisubunit Na+/H+ antiporter MnhB subunit
MEDSPRELRIASWTRGIFIGVLIAFYGWILKVPDGSFKQMFIVGAGVQLLIIVLRRFVPRDAQPEAQYIFEMVADGVTVLTFALGVFGGIVRAPAEL